MLTPEEIKSLAGSGEGYNVDFNVKVPSKMKEISSEVCAFANSEGGYLIIGIDNKGEITGAEIDNNKRSSIQDGIRDITPYVQVDMYPVNVDGKTVWVLDVPAGKDKPYILSGAIYVREGPNSQKLTTAEEIRSFFQTSNRIFFDAVPCKRFDVNRDLDEDNFDHFRRESRITGDVSVNQILENLQVFDESGSMKNGGALFFGKDPERMFPHAIIHCVLFKGTTKVHIIDNKMYGGSLYNQYIHAETWIKDKLRVAYIMEGMGPRKEIWEIPLSVFKEALINALSHRDYYEQGAVTMVEIYDDRVEISNPGGLLVAVKKEFGRKSMSRNPLIFGLFMRMNLVEKVASGIPRMQKDMKKAGLPEPVFTADGGFFTVSFKRTVKNGTINVPIKDANVPVNDASVPVNGTINESVPINVPINSGTIKEENGIVNEENGIVNEDNGIVKEDNGIVKEDNGIVKEDNGIVNEENGIVNEDNGIINGTIKTKKVLKAVLLFIVSHEGLSASEIAKGVGKSLRTTMRYIMALQKAGKIEFRGAPKTGGYFLKRE